MARGVQPSREQYADEAHITSQVQLRGDLDEVALLRELGASLTDLPESHPARRIYAKLVAHDRSENRTHVEMVELTRGAMAS